VQIPAVEILHLEVTPKEMRHNRITNAAVLEGETSRKKFPAKQFESTCAWMPIVGEDAS
jgi:hypothetical protein